MTTKSSLILASALALTPFGLACHRAGDPEASESTAATATPAATESSASTARPDTVEAPATTSTSTGLSFEPPKEWTVETPSSGMRKAQYRLPKVEGDPEDAELVVYYFGSGGGGGLGANIERWCSQFEQPDGRASKDLVVQAERKVDGMPVHEVELSGTYVAETAPGSGVRVNKPGFRMLAAVIEAEEGPYYAKLVGPEHTVERWASSFRDFVSRMKR